MGHLPIVLSKAKLRLGAEIRNRIKTNLIKEVVITTLEVAFLHNRLEDRKRRLEGAIALAPQKTGFAALLREVEWHFNEL